MKNKINRDPNDPNKGMDTRKFMISVVVALVLILVVAVIFLKTRQNTMMRGITRPAPTSSATPE